MKERQKAAGFGLLLCLLGLGLAMATGLFPGTLVARGLGVAVCVLLFLGVTLLQDV